MSNIKWIYTLSAQCIKSISPLSSLKYGFIIYTHNVFLPLASDDTEHIYSAVNKSCKVATRASHGRSATNNQVVAGYDLTTGVKQEDSAL